MSAILTAVLVFGCLSGSVVAGIWLRRRLPEHHLTSDSRDSVKLAMGLIATMTALLLGLLVGSAKGAYDGTRAQLIQMAAKVAFLDRVLSGLGPQAAPTRAQLRSSVETGILRLWPRTGGVQAAQPGAEQAGNNLFAAIHALTPHDDTEKALKDHAANLAVDLAQLRSQLVAQSVPSISMPLLVAVVVWLTVIYLAFSLLAPGNTTTIVALVMSALSVSGAIFLILEMDSPFEGLLHLPVEPLLRVIDSIGK